MLLKKMFGLKKLNLNILNMHLIVCRVSNDGLKSLELKISKNQESTLWPTDIQK